MKRILFSLIVIAAFASISCTKEKVAEKTADMGKVLVRVKAVDSDLTSTTSEQAAAYVKY